MDQWLKKLGLGILMLLFCHQEDFAN